MRAKSYLLVAGSHLPADIELYGFSKQEPALNYIPQQKSWLGYDEGFHPTSET
jgi:hypothetical protein